MRQTSPNHEQKRQITEKAFRVLQGYNEFKDVVIDSISLNTSEKWGDDWDIYFHAKGIIDGILSLKVGTLKYAHIEYSAI